MADTHTYKFNVSMSCSGCSGAVDRVLKKLEGKPVAVHPASLPSPSRRCPAPLLSHCHTGAKAGARKLTNTTTAGVESYEVSLENQTATVVAKDDLPYEKVLATIAKTGKKVNSGEADGQTQSVEVPAAA